MLFRVTGRFQFSAHSYLFHVQQFSEVTHLATCLVLEIPRLTSLRTPVAGNGLPAFWFALSRPPSAPFSFSLSPALLSGSVLTQRGLVSSMGSMTMSSYNSQAPPHGSTPTVGTGSAHRAERPSSPAAMQRSAPPPAPALNPSAMTQPRLAEPAAAKSSGWKCDLLCCSGGGAW